MMVSTKESGDKSLSGVIAYTVICKSSQRGKEFTDPRLAALAFLHARDQDRPFVLRHRGGTSYVIASSRTGVKRIDVESWDDLFKAAYDSLLTRT